MKLLWLTVAPLDKPGFRTTQFGMAIALGKLKWSVHLLGKSDRAESYNGFSEFCGKVTLIPRKGRLLTEVKYHISVWKILFKDRVDIVLFEPPHLRLMAIPAILSRLRVLRPSFILDVRTPLIDEAIDKKVDRLNYWLAMKFTKYILPGATVITEELKKDLQHLWGNNKRIAVWGSGVDAALFDPSKVTTLFREQFGLRGRFIFLYHGSVSLKRGLPELIIAMKQLYDENKGAALIILGDGPGKEELRDRIGRLELQNAVYFLGPVSNSDVSKYIAMADVGVLPLPNDRCWQVSSPLKLFEYMAMRLPIIVSDIPAARSVLGTSPFAVYVKETNPQSLYNALKLSIERLSDLKRNAYMAREIAEKKHTWAMRAKVLSDFASGFRR